MPPKGDRRKLQIIKTFKEMLMQEGYTGLHIGDICEKLNISRGTFYQYFNNKKEIIFVILDTVVEDIEDKLDIDEIIEFIKENPDMKVVKQYIINRVSGSITELIKEPIITKLIYKEIAGIDEEINIRINETVTKIIKMLSNEINKFKNIGIIDSSLDSIMSAKMFIGGLMIIIFDFNTRKMDVLDKSVIQSITNIFLNGAMK